MPPIRRSKKCGNAKRGKIEIASILLYLVAVPDLLRSRGDDLRLLLPRHGCCIELRT